MFSLWAFWELFLHGTEYTLAAALVNNILAMRLLSFEQIVPRYKVATFRFWQSVPVGTQLRCLTMNSQALGGRMRLPIGWIFSSVSRNASQVNFCASTSFRSDSLKTMHAVERASDSAAALARAQARFCREAGRPVCGSRICGPCTAMPEPLNEVCVRKNRRGALSSPRPHDHPMAPSGGSPARMVQFTEPSQN